MDGNPTDLPPSEGCHCSAKRVGGLQMFERTSDGKPSPSSQATFTQRLPTNQPQPTTVYEFEHVPVRTLHSALRNAAERGLLKVTTVSLPKVFVYVLRSKADPTRYYTRLTSHVAARLDAHNAGRCPHTARGRPWKVDVIIEFSDEERAVALERYLKSGSGAAFAKRHLR